MLVNIFCATTNWRETEWFPFYEDQVILSIKLKKKKKLKVIFMFILKKYSLMTFQL